MEIKKVSLFLLEVYLPSLQVQHRAVNIVSLEQRKGTLYRARSCLPDQAYLYYSLAELCCSLVLLLSPSSLFYLINRGNVFSEWSLNQFREAGLLLIIQLELYRLFYYWTETHQASFLELKCQILYRYMTSRNKYIKSQRKTEASGKL